MGKNTIGIPLATSATSGIDGTAAGVRKGAPVDAGVPVVFLHHLMAVLDDWDPRVIDGIAARHRVIAFDNRGGGGIDRINRIAALAYVKAALTLSDPRNFLFFPRNLEGKRAAKDYFSRLKERTENRDKPISLQARIAQLKAIKNAGLSAPDDLSAITHPVFVANGDRDLMVESSLSADMARRLPNAQLTICPDSGHGGVFQHHRAFVPAVLDFLAD